MLDELTVVKASAARWRFMAGWYARKVFALRLRVKQLAYRVRYWRRRAEWAEARALAAERRLDWSRVQLTALRGVVARRHERYTVGLTDDELIAALDRLLVTNLRRIE